MTSATTAESAVEAGFIMNGPLQDRPCKKTD